MTHSHARQRQLRERGTHDEVPVVFGAPVAISCPGNPMETMRSVNVTGAGFTTRIGSTTDIDILAAIDLDACELFKQAGLDLDPSAERAVSLAERKRWLACLAAGTVLIALDRSGTDVGFAAIGTRDGEPYLDQLSVRMGAMRQGIGTGLLRASVRAAREGGGQSLWLTTYSHLSWNRPYYERHGFVVVSLEDCRDELRNESLFERRWLPLPEERVVMRKPLIASS